MKLSELITHTSTWIGIPRTIVESHARYLREAGMLTSGGRGLAAPPMTLDDKITLFLSVCGVEVANRAADHVKIWKRLIRIGNDDRDFAFLRAGSVRDLINDLITKDLNGGALDQWLKEADDAYDRQMSTTHGGNHRITLDFYVDGFTFNLVISRYAYLNDLDHLPNLKQSAADTFEVRFIQPPPGGEIPFQMFRAQQGYLAPSSLIRRLDAKNLRGWGTCLTE